MCGEDLADGHLENFLLEMKQYHPAAVARFHRPPPAMLVRR